jgi:hypothetical protein
MSEKAIAIPGSEGPIEKDDSIGPEFTVFGPRACLPSRPATIRSGRQLLFFLLPTFIQKRWSPSVDSETYKRLHPTAWLDGIRGLAAFLVFLDHLSYSTHDVYTAWGAEGRNREFLKLPFIRFLYNGAAMVAIFFVVSGYALSYKPVRQMRNAEWEPLMQTFSSSVFRRAARLYLPCLASTLMIVALVRMGLYESTREFASDPVRLPGNHEHHPWRYETLSEQLYVWFSKMCSFMNPFTLEIKVGDAAIDIDGHLWTICVEYVSCTTFVHENRPQLISMPHPESVLDPLSGSTRSLSLAVSIPRPWTSMLDDSRAPDGPVGDDSVLRWFSPRGTQIPPGSSCCVEGFQQYRHASGPWSCMVCLVYTVILEWYLLGWPAK